MRRLFFYCHTRGVFSPPKNWETHLNGGPGALPIQQRQQEILFILLVAVLSLLLCEDTPVSGSIKAGRRSCLKVVYQ